MLPCEVPVWDPEQRAQHVHMVEVLLIEGSSFQSEVREGPQLADASGVWSEGIEVGPQPNTPDEGALTEILVVQVVAHWLMLTCRGLA